MNELTTLAVIIITKTCLLLAVLHYIFYQHTDSHEPPQYNTETPDSKPADAWATGKWILKYVVATALCWLTVRVFNTDFTMLQLLPQRRQPTLQELQARFPKFNITEEDLLDAEKELDELLKEYDEKEAKEKEVKDPVEVTRPNEIEDKKTI